MREKKRTLGVEGREEMVRERENRCLEKHTRPSI